MPKNIEEDNFHITKQISMKFSRKKCLMIVLKVTKKHGFTTSLENKVFENPQGWVKLTPTAFLGLTEIQGRNKVKITIFKLRTSLH